MAEGKPKAKKAKTYVAQAFVNNPEPATLKVQGATVVEAKAWAEAHQANALILSRGVMAPHIERQMAALGRTKTEKEVRHYIRENGKWNRTYRSKLEAHIKGD